MAKPKKVDRKIVAVRELKALGATRSQVEALELAVLYEVCAHAGIGGNAGEYVIARIEQLGGTFR